jgi:hypothetical protein
MNLPENRRPIFGIMRFRSRTVLPGDYYFRRHAPAEKKCAASPGGTFFILLRGPALSINPTQLRRKRRF